MKALYAGVILTPDAQMELRAWFETHAPLKADVKAHHMTFMFKPAEDVLRALPIGQDVTLVVTAYVDRDGVQAVEVTGAETMNAIAHITVAVDKGVSPVHSNVVLAGEKTEVNGPTLQGRWGFFDGKQDRFSFD